MTTVLEHAWPASVKTSAPPPVLRRKCACGGTPGPTGECEQCRKKRLGLQRQAASTGPAVAPPIVHDVLASSGAPLDSATRAFMEPRFGHSFADVRVHTDSRAAQSAAAVGALAYTVGRDVAFASGRYSPGSGDGRRLLAHELAHVVQQDGSTHGTLRPRLEVGAADDPLEREADAAADALDSAISPAASLSGGRTGTLQRKLRVVDPNGKPPPPPSEQADDSRKTNGTIVGEYVNELCSSFTVKGGFVSSETNDSKLPNIEACKCLRDMRNLSKEWKIEVDDSRWPGTDEDSREITVPSPYSGVEFGAWAAGEKPRRMHEPNWLLLGHELCGHALPMALGTHKTGRRRHGGRPAHASTVEVENVISFEHAKEGSEVILRGSFDDPHHGESFGRLSVDGFASGKADLPDSAKLAIETAAKLIESDRETKAEFVGHADTEGAEALSLAEKRAQAVRKALRKRVGLRFLQVKRAWGVGARSSSGNQPEAFPQVEIFLYAYRGGSEKHDDAQVE